MGTTNNTAAKMDTHSRSTESKPSTTPKRLEVFNIREVEGAKKPFFKNIGVAFVNRDGSLNVILDSLPMDGRLHIREPRLAAAPDGVTEE